jgi:hypothetical protein
LSAGVDQGYAVAVSCHERGAEVLFQRADLSAEDRLRDVRSSAARPKCSVSATATK